jgi:energy-coupling factor transporter ATP-binding protein EcfA2
VPRAPSPGRTVPESSAFTLNAPGPVWVRGKPRESEAARLHALLRDAFTPTRPKHDASMFSGRFREMERIIAAIEEERAHVVVFGERGSGKTSLCNILAGKATEAGYVILHYACSSGIGFEEIFRNFLRRIPGTFLAEGLGAGSRRVETFAQLLPEGQFGVTELVEAFARIHDRHVILVVDEYDRVISDDVKNKLAELLKIMSDAAVPVTMLLIGVADDVGELFGKHPSLQRTLVTVPMPLMPRRDLEGLIAAGEAHAGLTFVPEVREAIIDFAQGLPYQAQLLCLYAARNAVRRNSRAVERDDLRYAVERCAEEAEAGIKDAYGQAVGQPVESAFQDALFHAARARSDEFGSFTAADVAAAGPPSGGDGSLLALQFPLSKLTESERGSVLRRSNSATGPRYQFCSQMFRNYVLACQASRRGLI